MPFHNLRQTALPSATTDAIDTSGFPEINPIHSTGVATPTSSSEARTVPQAAGSTGPATITPARETNKPSIVSGATGTERPPSSLASLASALFAVLFFY